MGFRDEIEAGVAGLIVAADTSGRFRTVRAIGQLRKEDYAETGLLREPWCVVTWAGADMNHKDGKLIEVRARLEVVIGAVRYDVDKRKGSLFELLELVLGALAWGRIGGGYGPLRCTAEEGQGIDESGLEVWSQRWELGFEVAVNA